MIFLIPRVCVHRGSHIAHRKLSIFLLFFHRICVSKVTYHISYDIHIQTHSISTRIFQIISKIYASQRLCFTRYLIYDILYMSKCVRTSLGRLNCWAWMEDEGEQYTMIYETEELRKPFYFDYYIIFVHVFFEAITDLIIMMQFSWNWVGYFMVLRWISLTFCSYNKKNAWQWGTCFSWQQREDENSCE